jgi:hypothetical protein
MNQRIAVAAAVAFISAASLATCAHAVDLNLTAVSVGFRSDDLSAGTGSTYGPITSLYLPGQAGLTQRTLSFTFDPANAGSLPAGAWQWSDASGNNSLYGTYQTANLATGPASAILASPQGTMTVVGGTGYYSGASGHGTFEQFLIGTAFDPVTGLINGYQEVAVERLNVALPAEVIGTPKADTRGVTVIVKTGSNDRSTGIGVNSGYVTSVTPSSLPQLQQQEVQFTFHPDDPYSLPIMGTSRTFDDLGNESTGTFLETEPGASIGAWYRGSGSGKTTGGKGAYAGLVGSDDYEYFWLQTNFSDPPPTNTDYLEVVVDRGSLAPVPEPETYVLVAGGLVALGWSIRRRANS